MNNRPDDLSDRLTAAFDATRAEAQHFPSADQQTRARTQFLLDARSHSASSVSQTADMRLKDQTSALSDLTLQEGEQRMKHFYARQTRLIAAVMLGVIIAGGFWATPTLRAFAQSVLDFFIPTGSDTLVTQVPVDGGARATTSNPYAVTLDQVATQVDFAQLPTSLPAGYQFAAASYIPEMHKVGITYACNDLWMLTLIEQTSDTPAEPQKVGASANIIELPIRATTGQYVRGAWEAQIDQIGTAEPGANGDVVSVPQLWTENTDWQNLVWRENGINFTLTSNGSIGEIDAPSSCALNKDAFALVAQSLQPAS